MQHLLFLSTDIQCPALPNFTNGVITYSMVGPDEFPDSTMATYSCNDGYFLQGEGGRTCYIPVGALVGEFDGEEPLCIGKSKPVFD